MSTIVSEVLRVLRAREVEEVELVQMLATERAPAAPSTMDDERARPPAPWAARHGRVEMLLTREQFEALQDAGARVAAAP